MPEFFPAVYVRKMDLYSRYVYGAYSVPYSNGCMCICRGIYQDTVETPLCLADLFYYLAFMVGLDYFERYLFGSDNYCFGLLLSVIVSPRVFNRV